MDSHKYRVIGRSLLVPTKGIQKRLQRMGNWLNLYPECVNAEFGNKLLSNFVNFLLRTRSLDPLKRAGCSPDRDVVPEGKTGKNLDFKVRPDGRDILIKGSITDSDLFAET